MLAPIAFVANLGGGFTLGIAARLRLADATAVTRLGEDGWSASMLMPLSGHRNLHTSASTSNAVAAALAEHDPGRRHH
ncbi:hypothetical protein SAMN05444920_13152 [Nonomuraea solani]|uniref:Uncharacterized protein n=1 Tax=Nonomuraea solani TaxID=1144553 RepID=A0A1H6EYH4_9ACTN|nr:hypothetical protein [Nonomuraea solani]SEH02940.1 hypothetical protein SAMN05444920_13152 [Nonomuraea solani]